VECKVKKHLILIYNVPEMPRLTNKNSKKRGMLVFHKQHEKHFRYLQIYLKQFFLNQCFKSLSTFALSMDLKKCLLIQPCRKSWKAMTIKKAGQNAKKAMWECQRKLLEFLQMHQCVITLKLMFK